MTYSLYIWDCEDERWTPYETGLPLFALKPLIKSLRRSWDDFNFKVCRDDLDPHDAYDRDDARAARQLQIELAETVRDECPLFAVEATT
jgi:hypothetical protein